MAHYDATRKHYVRRVLETLRDVCQKEPKKLKPKRTPKAAPKAHAAELYSPKIESQDLCNEDEPQADAFKRTTRSLGAQVVHATQQGRLNMVGNSLCGEPS